MRLVLEHREDYPSMTAACRRWPAARFGPGDGASLGVQAEVDAGDRPGTTSEESAEIKALKAENRRLRRTNEILRRRRFSSRGNSTPDSR